MVAFATGAADTGKADSQKSGAAWPKGAYSKLNALPDWGGVWVLTRPRPRGQAAAGAGAAPAPAAPPEQPRFKGDYQTRYLAWQKQVRDNNGQVKKETSNCLPPGMPNMMATGQYPMEFLFTPGRVTTHHEAWMQLRAIYTDGRGHPDDLEAGFFGHSIGHWEGDTLVVDTIGIKTITELGAGMKHSDKLHLTERIHLTKEDPDMLVDEMTMEDPEALEVPYHRLLTYKRERDWGLLEFVCAENDRNPVDAEGKTGFK